MSGSRRQQWTSLALGLCLACLASVPASAGYTLTTLASFTAPSGYTPHFPVAFGLARDARGNLYGTTRIGGAGGVGTVFRIDASTSAFTTLDSFNGANGAYPQSGVTIDAMGNLYGATPNGGPAGAGVVYRIAAGTSTITTLASFDELTGGYVEAGLTLDARGNLYGTTQAGGTDYGTVFRIAAGTTTITTLASFDELTGYNLLSRLTLDARGNIYGIALQGGTDDLGTVFRLDAGASTLTTLVNFDGSNGAYPVSPLVIRAGQSLRHRRVGGG